MTDEEIKRRLSNKEDGWVERKEQGVSTDDIRKTLVAFANSVPENEEAILFIGVADDGSITGVDNPEKRQQQITKTASEWCYPPIKHNIRVLENNNQHIVAVIVQCSSNKPHFAGPAFVRIGSQSKAASEPEFESLIASRVAKARPLQQAMNRQEKVTIRRWRFGRGSTIHGALVLRDCMVVECTPHYAVFKPPSDQQISASYERIELSWNSHTKQLQIDIDG